jgi:hypothetical protein
MQRLPSRRPVAIREMVRRLDITPMTATNWRHGSKRRKPLPTRTIDASRRRVLIIERDLIAWLSEYRPDLVQQWQMQR